MMEKTKPIILGNDSLLDARDELAKEIGRRASDLVICPDCEKQGGVLAGQKLLVEGDNESRLFCPHCNLTVEIVVKNLSYQ